MARRTCLMSLVSFALIGEVLQAGDPVQWPGNGHWYEAVYVYGGISWGDAKLAAEAAGGYLATIGSEAENDFVFSVAVKDPRLWYNTRDTGGPWLGGYQPPDAQEPASGWTWITSEPFTYTNWGRALNDSSGKQDFLHFWGKRNDNPDSLWNDMWEDPTDHNAAAVPGYVREFESKPEPSTLPTCGGLSATDRLEARTDRYTVPFENVAELLKFVKELRKFRPRSSWEAAQHEQRARDALTTAAKRILSLEKDQWSESYQTALRVLLEDRICTIQRASPVEQQQTLGFVKMFLTAKAEKRIQPQDVELAISTGWALESSGNPELATQAYVDFAKLIAQSKDDRLSDTVQMLDGATRRLALVGKEMKLEGTKMDGTEFDWSAYDGKVVLVYFWAAEPDVCRAELASVKLNHQLYHDRGLEVIGISTDSDRHALEEFLENQQLPWVTLHEKAPEARHPMVTYYGVTSVPTALLVDKDGNVVSLWARGGELDRLLEMLLGPPYVPKGKLTYIDLQPDGNQKLAESFEGTDWPNNLAELPQGEQTFGGVKFRVAQSVIHVGRGRRLDLPTEVAGIPVNRTLTRLYIFQGTQRGFAPDGTLIGQYQVHYEDGTQETIPVILGEDVRDWWNNDRSKAITRGKVVWVGQNEASRMTNRTLRLYLAVWDNPHPNKQVVSIDFVCPTTSDAGPFCVAMTVEAATDPSPGRCATECPVGTPFTSTKESK